MSGVGLDPQALAAAVARLRAGGLVAIPTETVYGLAADATNAQAVAAIYALKARPRFNPLIIHVRDLAQARRHAALPQAALALAERFWPGPLTLVAPARPDSAVCDLARAGLGTIALRVPAHPTAQALLQALPFPLAAPSANRSGRISPTDAAAVAAEFGPEAPLILDGGRCAVGLESTIIGFDENGAATLLRPGGIAREAIATLIGPLAQSHAEGSPAAPGQLPSHYAPNARLRLNALSPAPGEAYLGFGHGAAPGWPNLSPSGDLAEAAANLFSMLRALDATGAHTIAVAPIPDHGLGEAIQDRLARAAAPR